MGIIPAPSIVCSALPVSSGWSLTSSVGFFAAYAGAGPVQSTANFATANYRPDPLPFDLVWSSEVLEHIPYEAHCRILNTLALSAKRWVIFSAGTSWHGGHDNAGPRPSMDWRMQWISRGFRFDLNRTRAPCGRLRISGGLEATSRFTSESHRATLACSFRRCSDKGFLGVGMRYPGEEQNGVPAWMTKSLHICLPLRSNENSERRATNKRCSLSVERRTLHKQDVHVALLAKGAQGALSVEVPTKLDSTVGLPAGDWSDARGPWESLADFPSNGTAFSDPASRRDDGAPASQRCAARDAVIEDERRWPARTRSHLHPTHAGGTPSARSLLRTRPTWSAATTLRAHGPRTVPRSHGGRMPPCRPARGARWRRVPRLRKA